MEHNPLEDEAGNPEYRELALKVLQGNHCEWPDSASTSHFIAYAESQGVLMLLENHNTLIQENWPPEIAKAVLIACAAGKRLQQHRRDITTRLLNLCHRMQLDILLFKGAANAFLIYDKPYQRQHADIDLLVRQKDVTRIVELLKQTDFLIDPVQSGEFGPYQATARHYSENYPVLMVDVHWKINNRLLLADTLSFEELRQRSVTIDAYGESARGFGYQDALLASCIHDAGSLPAERDKLISLHDAHLLMNKLGQPALKRLLDLAAGKGIGTICFDYLSRAAGSFKSEDQQQWLAACASGLQQSKREPSAKLLCSRPSWIQDHRLDFIAVKGVHAKARYITQKLLRKIRYSE